MARPKSNLVERLHRLVPNSNYSDYPNKPDAACWPARKRKIAYVGAEAHPVTAFLIEHSGCDFRGQARIIRLCKTPRCGNPYHYRLCPRIGFVVPPGLFTVWENTEPPSDPLADYRDRTVDEVVSLFEGIYTPEETRRRYLRVPFSHRVSVVRVHFDAQTLQKIERPAPGLGSKLFTAQDSAAQAAAAWQTELDQTRNRSFPPTPLEAKSARYQTVVSPL